MKPEYKEKPLMLTMQDAEKKLVNCVNEVLRVDKVPCYFLEIILDKIHQQVKAGAGKELANASAQYACENHVGPENPAGPTNGPEISETGGKDGENGLGA